MFRYRIKFRKIGAIRFTSHRDTMRVFQRGLVSAGVPLCYSQGFNPHPRFSFGPSLRTGWEGHGEYLDAFLESRMEDLPVRCNRHLPAGLEILEASEIDASAPSLSVDVCAARYGVTVDEADVAFGRHPRWDAFIAARREPGGLAATALESAIREAFPDHARPKENPETAAAPALLEIRVSAEGGGLGLEYLTSMHQGRGLSAEELLEPFLGDPADLEVPLLVVRKALYVTRDGRYHSPIDEGVVQRHT